MTLTEYINLVSEPEAAWLMALKAHAFDTGKPLEVALAEALVERHREALAFEQANTNLRETISRITK